MKEINFTETTIQNHISVVPSQIITQNYCPILFLISFVCNLPFLVPFMSYIRLYSATDVLIFPIKIINYQFFIKLVEQRFLRIHLTNKSWSFNLKLHLFNELAFITLGIGH